MRSPRTTIILRFSPVLVFLGALLCLAATPAPAQNSPKLKPDPKTIPQTVAWLEDVITKYAGFTLTPTASSQDILTYRFNEGYDFNQGDACHLNWRAVPVGDEDLLSIYPGVNQVEDLATIVPGSIFAQPIDVQSLLAGAADHPIKIDPNFQSSSLYWRIAASYANLSRGEIKPFGFLFKDMQTAQHVATVLEHGVNLCRQSNAPEEETYLGCDTSFTKKVVNEGGDDRIPLSISLDPFKQQVKINGGFVNHADQDESCVLELMYYSETNGTWIRSVDGTFDLAPGEKATGILDVPQSFNGAVKDYGLQCFPKGAVNVHQNLCRQINHAVPLNPRKEQKKTVVK